MFSSIELVHSFISLLALEQNEKPSPAQEGPCGCVDGWRGGGSVFGCPGPWWSPGEAVLGDVFEIFGSHPLSDDPCLAAEFPGAVFGRGFSSCSWGVGEQPRSPEVSRAGCASALWGCCLNEAGMALPFSQPASRGAILHLAPQISHLASGNSHLHTGNNKRWARAASQLRNGIYEKSVSPWIE